MSNTADPNFTNDNAFMRHSANMIRIPGARKAILLIM